MKSKITCLNIILILTLSVSAQNIELTFSAKNNSSYVKLDSIKIKYIESGAETVYYWPDTVVSVFAHSELLYVGYATISTVGIQDPNNRMDNFTLFQNHPNPVSQNTTIPVYIPETGLLTLLVYDLVGRLEFQGSFDLAKGYHGFCFSAGQSSTYIVSAIWESNIQSIKLLSNKSVRNNCSIDYLGDHVSIPLENKEPVTKMGELRESGIVGNSGANNQDYVFEYAYNIPCPDVPTVTYEGQTYNTVQIMNQCWLKEYLNLGEMINNTEYQEDNGIVEKYCPENLEDSCTKYGGLYQWGEVMAYSTQEGAQGLCPPGWHIPTDEEVKLLEGVSDSQYLIGDDIWNITGAYRGSDCGFNLKSEYYWNEGANGNDLFGLTLLPSGFADPLGYYAGPGENAGLWTSSSLDEYTPWFRNIYYPQSAIKRSTGNRRIAFPLRCLKD